jgi:hypothetical protein
MEFYKFSFESVISLQSAHFYKMLEIQEVLNNEKIDNYFEGFFRVKLLEDKESKKEYEKIIRENSKLRERFIKIEKNVMTLADFEGV